MIHNNTISVGATNSIIIGYNLHTNKSYHLLVDIDGIKIDKIMTEEEYETISLVIQAMGKIK